MEFKRNAGFTLIELIVVVLIIMTLAAIAIPKYFVLVEKTRVTEGREALDVIRASQERYLANYSQYASSFTAMDISYPNISSTQISLVYFNIGMTSTSGTGYTLTMTRTTGRSAVPVEYGIYSIVLDVTGPNMLVTPTPAISACAGTMAKCQALLK